MKSLCLKKVVDRFDEIKSVSKTIEDAKSSGNPIYESC